MKQTDPELLADRAADLEAKGLNGIELVFVDLLPAAAPDHARLRVKLHNQVAVGAIDDAVNLQAVPASAIFTLRGGTRIIAGEGHGQLHIGKVGAAPDPDSLVLLTSGIGDYSTYSLGLAFSDPSGKPLIDPLLASIGFKFRPGCFNLPCAPVGDQAPPPHQQPDIDYLARDFDSIKHLLLNAMRERVPDWQPTSEADLDLVILDLLAADADELCDFQDRIMQEAYLGLARKRLSLARHARLLDYHIHQGNQAGTWLAAEVSQDLTLPAGTGVWSGEVWSEPAAVIFVTRSELQCRADLNRLGLYTWGGVVTALDAGATEAEIALSPTLSDAMRLRDQVRRPEVSHLVIEEKLNPETGATNGRDLRGRRLLRLLDGDEAAEVGFDPVEGHWFVRVRWQAADALDRRFCFVSRLEDGTLVEGISAFHGNLVYAGHGRPHRALFRPPGSELGSADDRAFQRYDETWWETTPSGTVAALPQAPLAYRDTPPGGEIPPQTTTLVRVSGFSDPWEECIDLIGSEGDDLHYQVETDERGQSRLRFGNGRNGMPLGNEAEVTCDYQVGGGSAGNLGADTLTGFDATGLPGVLSLRNPFDVVDGRDPEPRREIIRRVPEAYRQRQLRAVTLADYVHRAEELVEVAHAQAGYAWTGSWRTVQVAIDPSGTTELDESTRRRIEGHLDAVRLIGEDLEVRPARYAPLDIELVVCAHPDYWPEDLEAELQRELSDGWAAAGRPGFFHPDAWTFGQPLYASQIIGRTMEIEGVERVSRLSMRRWNPGTGAATGVVTLAPQGPPDAQVALIEVEVFEIIQVANDPDHLEHGRIQLDIRGGRQ